MSATSIDTTDDAFLGGSLRLLQPRLGFRAGIDAVLLAASASVDRDQAIRALDAGAGVGTAGLCLAQRQTSVHVTLAERDGILADLARRNVDRNKLGTRVDVAEVDLLAAAADIEQAGVPAGAFDLVISNPPWLLDGQGRACADPIRARANAMAAGDLDRWMRALARAASADAELIVIHRADALSRLLSAIEGRFGGTELMPVHSRDGEAANRILVRARKGSRAPLTLLPGVVIHEREGGFKPDIEAVLRAGAPLSWVGRADRR